MVARACFTTEALTNTNMVRTMPGSHGYTRQIIPRRAYSTAAAVQTTKQCYEERKEKKNGGMQEK